MAEGHIVAWPLDRLEALEAALRGEVKALRARGKRNAALVHYRFAARLETILSSADGSAVPTQQQFDLSSFRKKAAERRDEASKTYDQALRRGWESEAAEADGRVSELEWVLALLPGEEST